MSTLQCRQRLRCALCPLSRSQQRFREASEIGAQREPFRSRHGGQPAPDLTRPLVSSWPLSAVHGGHCVVHRLQHRDQAYEALDAGGLDVRPDIIKTSMLPY